MLKVQKIACVNNAGFVMNFGIEWLNKEGTWTISKWRSENFPINQTRTSHNLDHAEIGVPTDAVAVAPRVWAIGGTGEGQQGTPYVLHEMNGQTATYTVTGTTLIFSVKRT